jgi:multicomponent Na+:H+ antiporter subunit D
MDSLVALPVAIPLLAAAMFVAVRVFVPLRIYELAGIGVAAATSVVSAVILAGTRDELLVHWFGGWEPREGVAVGISFAADPFGAGLALLASVLVTAALVFSWHFYEDAGPLYPILMLLFLGGMTGFALSGDLFNMFVFFELMGVAAYALTAYRIEDVGPIQGAINFAVTNSIGGVLLLAGTALLYGRTGALNLAQLGEAVDGTAGGVLVVAFLLVAVGFLVKAAVVPFHFWLADAYAVAPLPVCAVLAGVMSDLGVYGIARVYWTVFEGSLGPHEAGLRALLVAVGVLSALVGAVMCFLQRHLKRLLAYSTISDVGVFLAGIGLLQPKALAGVGLYVVAHGYLTPGGGFQGGVLLAAAAALLYLAGSYRGFRSATPEPLLDAAEGAGAGAYAALGVATLAAGSSFLANVLPLGKPGTLASAGTMPILSAAVGVAVAAAFVLLFTEFLEELVLERRRGR